MTSAVVIDLKGLPAAIDNYAYQIKAVGFVQALTKGAKIIKAAYRAELKKVHKEKRKRSLSSAGNPLAIAYESLDHKVEISQNGSTVYAVVGSKRKGGQRVAPHILWDEKGTKLRRTKTGANRGRVPPQMWLERAVAASNARTLVMAELRAYFATTK